MGTAELQVRKPTNGLMAEGLLLGLWVGDVLVATEYWLLRGGELGLRMLRLFTRPLRLAMACGALAAGALVLEAHTQADAAKIRRAKEDERIILNAAALYRAQTSRWPPRLEKL